jgi:hypothetical protein
MKWIALASAFLFFSCKTSTSKAVDLVDLHTEKAYVYLIKIPHEAIVDDIFDGGNLMIRKPKKGKVLLQFEGSGTLNTVVLWSSETGDFKKSSDCIQEKESNFQTSMNSTIDVTDMTGRYLIRYNSCNIGGTYLLTIK